MKYKNLAISKNGRGDLVIMSIEADEALSVKIDLYPQLDEGRTAVEEARKRPLNEAMKHIKQSITDGKI